MKILILAPFNYADARHDLQVLNYSRKVYSLYFIMEGLLHTDPKIGITESYVYLSSQYEQDEYEKFDVFYGLLPKDFEFDMIICYNKDILESQEALLAHSLNMSTGSFYDTFYTSADATHFVDNIYEVIKLAKL